MENVYGILTKDGGKIKDRILEEIRNIVDYDALAQFVAKCEAYEKSSNAKSMHRHGELQLALRTLQCSLSRSQEAVQRRKDYLTVKAQGGIIQINF